VALLDAVSPRACVHRAIAPLTGAVARHAPHLPLTLVLPALLLADKHAVASLIPVRVRTIVQIAIRELPDPVTVRNVIVEVAIIELAFGEGILAEAFHLAHNPIALVRLLEALAEGLPTHAVIVAAARP